MMSPTNDHETSWTDRCLAEADRALRTLFARPRAQRPNPAGDGVSADLSASQRKHLAGLMRINHVGEICAQALYSGQAVTARNPAARTLLLEAAREETDHLAWCAERLEEIGDRPSLLNPLWYGGAFAIGAVAGLLGDRLSLGFVMETEAQVEAHLQDHLDQVEPDDERTRRILDRMKADEARHGHGAKQAGGIDLPPPLPSLMRFAAGLMRKVAYRI